MGGVKGRLNNVKKNCTIGRGWLPLNLLNQCDVDLQLPTDDIPAGNQSFKLIKISCSPSICSLTSADKVSQQCDGQGMQPSINLCHYDCRSGIVINCARSGMSQLDIERGVRLQSGFDNKFIG